MTRLYLFPLFYFLLILSLSAQVRHTFIVTGLPPEVDGCTVGVHGNLPPLSWDTTTELYAQADGSFAVTVDFAPEAEGQILAYKFVYIGKKGKPFYELDSAGDRLLVLNKEADDKTISKWGIKSVINTANLPRISAENLQKDLSVIRQALSLHPGRYRYNNEESLQSHLDQLAKDFSSGLTHAEAYLALSRLLASIRCGHTFANIYNQNSVYKHILSEQADKLPLAFSIIDRRMIVKRHVSEEQLLDGPAEILRINDIPVSSILDTLLQFVPGDGRQPANPLYRLQLDAKGQYETFDLLFPLLFAPRDGKYELEVYLPQQDEHKKLSVEALTLSERTARMFKKYPKLPRSYDDLWRFEMLDNSSAYLRLGTFVTYKMDLDWKGFLADAFADLRQKDTRHLIIDIRGNAGGMDEVLKELQRYLLTKPIEVMPYESRSAYQRVPEDLRPYCSTWDDRIFDLSNRTTAIGQGMYRVGNTPKSRTLRPGKRPFEGKVYLLIDAGNSSATFLLARYAKQGGFAELIGEPTGGNLNGINGGYMFFVKLPHSGLEFDLPVFGSFPTAPQEDRGIEPDVYIPQTVDDAFNGKDTVMEYVLKRISGAAATETGKR